MHVLCVLIAFGACVVGKICGMGGGVIIKPVLDATGMMTVAQINFLSCCTVLGMTCWSVGKSLACGTSQIDLKASTPLAVGAAVGGLVGKRLFAAVTGLFADANTGGGVQAAALLAATLATLLYTLERERFKRPPVRSGGAGFCIGLLLGVLGTFLGIGGGPFNMAVLYYFFSMTSKTAAQNSLYIILFSQAVGLLSMVMSGSVPEVSRLVLLGMVAGGVAGSEAGGWMNRRLSEQQVTRLFQCAMVLVMGICAYNIHQFLL